MPSQRRNSKLFAKSGYSVGSEYALTKFAKVNAPGTPGGVVFRLFHRSMARGVSTRYTTNMLTAIKNNVSA
jgi:hypothetical protein